MLREANPRDAGVKAGFQQACLLPPKRLRTCWCEGCTASNLVEHVRRHLSRFALASAKTGRFPPPPPKSKSHLFLGWLFDFDRRLKESNAADVGVKAGWSGTLAQKAIRVLSAQASTPVRRSVQLLPAAPPPCGCWRYRSFDHQD